MLVQRSVKIELNASNNPLEGWLRPKHLQIRQTHGSLQCQEKCDRNNVLEKPTSTAAGKTAISKRSWTHLKRAFGLSS